MNYDEFRHLVLRAGFQIQDLAEVLAVKRTSLYHYSSQSHIPRYLAVIAILVAELAASGRDCRQLLTDVEKWGAGNDGAEAEDAAISGGGSLGNEQGTEGAPSVPAKRVPRKAIFVMNHAEGVGATTLATTIIDAYAARDIDLKVFEFAHRLDGIYGERVTVLDAVPSYEEDHKRFGFGTILDRYDVVSDGFRKEDVIVDVGASSTGNIIKWFEWGVGEILADLCVDVEVWIPTNIDKYSIERANETMSSFKALDIKVILVCNEVNGRLPKGGPVAEAVAVWRRQGISCLTLKSCQSGLWREIQKRHLSPAQVIELSADEIRRDFAVGKMVAECGLSVYRDWIEGWWRECRNAGVFPLLKCPSTISPALVNHKPYTR